MRPMRTTSVSLFAALLAATIWLPLPLRAEEAPPAPVAAPKPAPAKAPPATAPLAEVTGRLEVVEGQRVLTLWGTARQRGYAHGYLLAEEIIAGVEHDFERVLKPFLPKYKILVRTMVIPNFSFNKRETEELEGLYEGLAARLPKEKMHIGILERDLDLIDIKALNTFGDWYGLGCSSLAVWGALSADGKPLVGRNFDFPAFDLVLRHQFVVVRAADGEAGGYVGVGYPGCIGVLTGLNAEGVFAAIHDVPIRPALDKALRKNVPRLIALRRILEYGEGKDTCKQVHALVKDWPTLYGNNLMIVGPAQKDSSPCVAVLEYDCRLDLEGGCTLRLDDPLSADEKKQTPLLCLACTNHHRARQKPEKYFEFRKRWRYSELSCVGGTERPAKPLTVTDMFSWMGRTAFPRGDRVQGRASAFIGPQANHGTLHQVVAQPSARLLYVRLGQVGKHIRDIPERRHDVSALLSSAGQ